MKVLRRCLPRTTTPQFCAALLRIPLKHLADDLGARGYSDVDSDYFPFGADRTQNRPTTREARGQGWERPFASRWWCHPGDGVMCQQAYLSIVASQI